MNDFENQMMQRANEFSDAEPELKKQSEIREKNKTQFEEVSQKEDGEDDDGLSNEDIERRPCTQAEKEKLDASVEQLGNLFADADFFWQLDGALNISLYCGDYIGIHKDIDVSIDETEIDKVEAFLAKRGHGFFFAKWNEETQKRTFERVSADQYKRNKSHQMMIISINEEGKIIFDSTTPHIDTHIIRRGEGDSFIGHEFTKLPQEWFKPRKVNFHDEDINCSHPALVAYYKLFHHRAYDDNDLKLLAQSGKLTKTDVNLIEKTFNQHIEDLQKILRDFADRITPQINQFQNKEEIFDIMINDQLFKKMQRDNPEAQKFLMQISEKLAETEEDKGAVLYKLLHDATNIVKLLSKKDMRFAILRDGILLKK